MMIVLKKVKRGYSDHYLRRNVKEGLKEIRNDFRHLIMKGDCQTLTVYPKTSEEARYIKIIANNYTIPYTVRL